MIATTDPFIAHAAADLTTCDREPIHTPGSIQPEGALLVARASDLRISHTSANLDPGVLGQSLDDVIGVEARAAIEAALRDDGGVLTRICSAEMPVATRPRCNVVVHRLKDRIYVEFEPFGEEGERDILLARAHSVIQSMRQATTRQQLCDIAVREIRALTGYDRVMAYRFNRDGHGDVVSEARDPALEPLLGWRYPASDIPKQARRMYLLQRVRVIADVGYTPVPVLAHPALQDDCPLDMTFCNLRGISPLHIEYLSNMGVRATLAISLVQDEALWGMLICHHGAPRRVSAHLRALCDLIGQLMSLLLGSTGQAEMLAERLNRQTMLDAISASTLGATSVAAALIRPADELLGLVRADGALLRIGGQVHLIGRTPDLAQALEITAAMRSRFDGETLATHCLGVDLPAFASVSDVASGVLTLPILNNPEDAITWFRPAVAQTLKWGGDPGKAMDEASGRLSPRKSFAAWVNEVKGQALPWTAVDLQIAQELRRIIDLAMLSDMETQARLAHLRHYDALTGLPNRRFLEERLASRAAAVAARDAMIFLDLDRFKTVNDSLGHAVGDELLVGVAKRLVENVPEPHQVVRLGGDEFVVICEDAPMTTVQAIADRIITAFCEPFELAGRPYRMTTSIGVATAGSDQLADLMQAADTAMYAAKRKGGNQAVTFDSHLHDSAAHRLELEQDLYLALERREFELHYQPLVSVQTGQVYAFEALLRWRHPTRGLVPPGDFIPLAEENGQIVPIGSWVMQEALRQLHIWRTSHRQDLLMSVNVSSQQVSRPEFSQEVTDVLASTGLPPSALLLEVTESILMLDVAVAHLHALREQGIQIAVDDFGTGYSSLAYLQTLPVDAIKIDRLFLRQVGIDARQTAFMGVLIEMGRTLDLKVIAEGVEREDQWQLLQEQGCHGAQGFWLGRPVPSSEAEHLLRAEGGRALALETCL